MKYFFTIYPSPIGELRITFYEDSIVELILPCQNTRYADAVYDVDRRISQTAVLWLDKYFSSKNPQISEVLLRPSGTEFQIEVWERLCRIPYGTTVTYGQLASEIAQLRGIRKMSAQAVGQAVGANPISIIIPCHRVVGSNGKLTGYDGGLENKAWLLKHENKMLW